MTCEAWQSCRLCRPPRGKNVVFRSSASRPLMLCILFSEHRKFNETVEGVMSQLVQRNFGLYKGYRKPKCRICPSLYKEKMRMTHLVQSLYKGLTALYKSWWSSCDLMTDTSVASVSARTSIFSQKFCRNNGTKWRYFGTISMYKCTELSRI